MRITGEPTLLFCRIHHAAREAEEAARILEAHRRAGGLSPERLAALERYREVHAMLEPVVLGYYARPEDLPPEVASELMERAARSGERRNR